jgi:hypothetical protein
LTMMIFYPHLAKKGWSDLEKICGSGLIF